MSQDVKRFVSKTGQEVTDRELALIGLRTLGVLRAAYDKDQPRDDHGRWTDGPTDPGGNDPNKTFADVERAHRGEYRGRPAWWGAWHGTTEKAVAGIVERGFAGSPERPTHATTSFEDAKIWAVNKVHDEWNSAENVRAWRENDPDGPRIRSLPVIVRFSVPGTDPIDVHGGNDREIVRQIRPEWIRDVLVPDSPSVNPTDKSVRWRSVSPDSIRARLRQPKAAAYAGQECYLATVVPVDAMPRALARRLAVLGLRVMGALRTAIGNGNNQYRQDNPTKADEPATDGDMETYGAYVKDRVRELVAARTATRMKFKRESPHAFREGARIGAENGIIGPAASFAEDIANYLDKSDRDAWMAGYAHEVVQARKDRGRESFRDSPSGSSLFDEMFDDAIDARKLRGSIGNGNNQYRQDNPTKDASREVNAAASSIKSELTRGYQGGFGGGYVSSDDLEVERNGDAVTVAIRYFGSWENPSDAEDEEDYDWQEPTERTRATADKIAERASQKHNVDVSWHSGEKNWLYFEVRDKKPRTAEFNPDQPRDEHGRWTSDGGFEHTGVTWKQDVDPKTGRPIPIPVKSIDEAIVLILGGQVVELPDVKGAATLLDKLHQIALDAKAKGEDAPNYDLCNVSVKGTNLFCTEKLRSKEYPNGVPRLEMPQLGGKPVPGSEADTLPRNPWDPTEVDGSAHFISYLQGIGMRTTRETFPAANLKASQAELVGSKIAAMMVDRNFDPAKNPVFVSNDNYVVDGHHRWAAVVARDAENDVLGDIQMNVVRVNAPISEVLHLANAWSKRFGIKQAAGPGQKKKK